MGVIISTTRYAPLAFTSAIIGFFSFAFTLATFLRVIWQNLMTMSEAPHEVHAFLTNIRTELLEERATIKVMRKQGRKYQRQMRKEDRESLLGIELDDVSLKTMSDSVKHLTRQFKEIEKPFLAPGSHGIDNWKQHTRRRNSSVSPYYEHSAYASPPEKAGVNARARSGADHERGRRAREDDDDDADKFSAQRCEYASWTVGRRFKWLSKKSKAQELLSSLSRVQIRRIARQTGGMAYLMHEYGMKTCVMEQTLSRIEERMNTIVGVRRVNG